MLVVGIAGGVPSHEFTLGDVVVSSRIPDFSVEAVIRDKATAFDRDRDHDWTTYACEAAAAFTRALLLARPIAPITQP